MSAEGTDPYDRRIALRAGGLLGEFNAAGVLDAGDVHVATRLGVIVEEHDAEVLLALALTARAVRLGATCLDLATAADTVQVPAPTGSNGTGTGLLDTAELPWPDPASWTDRVRASPLVGQRLLRIDLGRLYLDRYWREEVQVRDDLLQRLAAPAPQVDAGALAAGAARVFPRPGYEEQRTAATRAASRLTTVLTGGPGTGKTATVAGLLALVTEQQPEARIALAAPTGKASARLQESVGRELRALPAEDAARLADLRSVTLHRLLGSLQPRTGNRFRHDRHHRLPHDVVVVDESSMVSLTMMARLLEALRPDARLVLVGDPGQLSPVEAGAVLADLVDGLHGRSDSPVEALQTTHRFAGSIAELEQALRVRDADQVMHVLTTGADVELVDPTDAEAVASFREVSVDAAYAVTAAAEAGESGAALQALEAHRLLCAHRSGPYGVTGWNRWVERLLADRTGLTHYEEWYAGRPVLVLANDHGQGLYNGDTGVTVRAADGRLRVVVPGAEGPREFATTRLADVQTLYAMTVHKSQGSQAREVSVVLPPPESPLLTHELLYTAVTRAEARVRVLGTEAAVRAAVARTVQRASGLAERLALSR
ncbi:exodeoxyribonuclease V subunit alpha [Nocardioides mangrovicus]|uniref:RecBCD enzyme subunit RecD n=1 Tax=Nocardioides mangrovicus TaxID=2478913 RepID=A0A3L8NZA4_9ACTN|nr:exodeoxyribonuclease V subunit alpha [Nocardioides mangrovicus]RLV47992.1 exodeoxyribonuclease V subunit alpha [Nocardioides mangrovicus]